MNFITSNFSNLKNNFYKSNFEIYRFFIYVAMAIAFYKFMQINSPLGINWRPYHYERVLNAVSNIFNNLELSSIGYTSWENVDQIREKLLYKDGEIYVIPIINYVFPAALFKILGNFDYLSFLNIVDYIFITFVGIIIAEVGILTTFDNQKVDSMFYGISIFALFLTSPWTYRMILAPWSEVPFLGFYLISIYLFIKNKRNSGLFFLILSVLFNWIYGVLLFLFQSLFFGLNYVSNKNSKTNKVNFKYLPCGLQNRNGFLVYSSICLIPLLINFIQTLILRMKGIQLGNSGVFYRIGIDSFENIHHGGLIGAFQFLGGNRYSLCFLSDNLIKLNLLDKYISIFNCTLSITSLVLISLFSIIGYFILIKNFLKFDWALTPIAWTFLFFAFIFQQSFAAHLHGHSFLFGFIFSLGLVSLLKFVSKKFNLSDVISKVIIIPLISGVIINSIRVSFLTGING